MQATSTFWAATHLLPRAELATIPQMKEETQGFRIIPNIQIFISEIALFLYLSPFKPGRPGTVWGSNLFTPSAWVSPN